MYGPTATCLRKWSPLSFFALIASQRRHSGGVSLRRSCFAFEIACGVGWSLVRYVLGSSMARKTPSASQARHLPRRPGGGEFYINRSIACDTLRIGISSMPLIFGSLCLPGSGMKAWV